MNESNTIETFTRKHDWLGPVAWIVSLQYFVVQIIVMSAWSTRYSLISNAISDLGNTACGPYAGRYVCSPLHTLMDASFVVLGITMIIGSLCLYQQIKKSRATWLGFGFMALAGVGSVLVGLFPENTVSALHITGAALPFLIGNIGVILLGLSLPLARGWRAYSILSGATALFALALLITQHYVGLGFGGVERIVAYPQTVWLIVTGACLLWRSK